MAKNALISIVEDDQLFRESMRQNTGSPETDQYHLPPSRVGRASSKSRNGRRASSVSRCLRQAWSYYVLWEDCERVFCRAWRVGDDGRPLCWSFCLSLTTRRPQACERLAHEREGSLPKWADALSRQVTRVSPRIQAGILDNFEKVMEATGRSGTGHRTW